jgi:truncated hemoglobin YjbI
MKIFYAKIEKPFSIHHPIFYSRSYRDRRKQTFLENFFTRMESLQGSDGDRETLG